MKQTRIFLLPALLTLAATAWGQTAKSGATAAPQAQPSPQSAPTLASMVDSEISAIEKQVVDVAEAMPEDKYNFSPESLNILGDDYKGVRTFATQFKHLAAPNHSICSTITGDNLPNVLKDGNRPTALKPKPDTIKFLKDSF